MSDDFKTFIIAVLLGTVYVLGVQLILFNIEIPEQNNNCCYSGKTLICQ